MSMNAGTKKKIIGVAVLAAVIIGGSFWTGWRTEQRFRDSIEEMDKLGVQVSLLDYRRGLFSATARTEVLTPTFGTLSFSHSIWHGPLLAFASSASIRSELMLSENLTAQLRAAFGDDPFKGKTPLTVTSTFGLFGGNSFHIVSPKFEAVVEKDQTKLSWGGLDGKITLGSDYSKVKADVVLDGLSVESREIQIQMGRTSFQSDIKKPSGYEILYVGTSNLALDKLSFHATAKESDSIRALTVENFSSKNTTSINKGALDIKIQFGADTLDIDDKPEFSIKKLGLTFLYENIDGKAIEAFSKDSPHTDRQKTIQESLLRKPSFSVKDVSATWPEGVTTGNFRIAYIGDGDIDKFSPADLNADLQISLPTALFHRLLADQFPVQADNLNALIEKGILIEKDGVLTIDASFKDNVLNLNGKQEPLEALRSELGF